MIDLMASPLACGLFDKAIAESAYMINNAELKATAHGTPSAEAIGMKIAAALKASDIAALRAIPADTLTKTAPKLGYAPFPTIDGWVLKNRLVKDEQVTVAAGVATVWLGLVDHLERTGGAVPSLERLLLGGS